MLSEPCSIVDKSVCAWWDQSDQDQSVAWETKRCSVLSNHIASGASHGKVMAEPCDPRLSMVVFFFGSCCIEDRSCFCFELFAQETEYGHLLASS